MYNKINHLCYGRLVVKDIGYSRNNEKYEFEIFGNYGDLYNVNGTTDLLAMISFNINNNMSYILSVENSNFDLNELSEIITIINQCWRK